MAVSKTFWFKVMTFIDARLEQPDPLINEYKVIYLCSNVAQWQVRDYSFFCILNDAKGFFKTLTSPCDL